MKQPPEPRPELADDDPVEVGKAIALRRLGRLPQTEAQLTEYLLRKGVPEAAAEVVVARLAELRLVDDAEYAAMWVRSRRAVRKSGSAAIRRELQQRGVAAELVEAALAAEPADEFALAMELGARKWQTLLRLEEPARSNRVVGFLVRRGHSLATAYRVVGELRSADV